MISFNYRGKEYYYIRNTQGDIIGLYDSTGTKVVTYTYDSWGKHISIVDNTQDKVGEKNPYRYRGYRYNSETGIYYLNSRYYNPDWGRFINADGIVGQTGEVLGHNLFAYCKNNVVNMSDDSGYRPVYSLNGEETDEMRNASYAVMNKRIQAFAGKSKINSSSSFSYKYSAMKAAVLGGIDTVGEKISKTFIKERKVWRSFGTLAAGEYVSNISKGVRAVRKGLGVVGAIGSTANDVIKSVNKKQYIGAGIDILSAVAGFGVGLALSAAGAWATVTFGVSAAVVGVVGFGLGVGASIIIDKIASAGKGAYYGR